ncbi:uncharacterized protein LODBEIA_P41630 [Lodderomyces beijingensis]|uniref:Arsenical-resistance protein ACR3 n=1 Tax=Lodderomyces beijingensis TaxID=1775926 RepID=A0ABP0ZP54_9ASCO
MRLISSRFRSDWNQVLKEMSLLDKLLPFLIILAMIIGILLSIYVPNSRRVFTSSDGENKLTTVSIPLTVGLIIMMVPPFCKVQYEKLLQLNKSSTRHTKYMQDILISLVLNWVVGPLLMFGLSWAVLFNEPEYRVGVIMIGMARCIAMVLLWNQLALGSNELCAILVVLNSLLQIVLYAPYQILFCYVITGEPIDFDSSVTMGDLFLMVLKNIAIFLAMPLAFGVLIRVVGLVTVGRETFETKVMPWIGPWALAGLLYTILIIFITKGDTFIHEIHESLKCLIPLSLYFLIMWFGTFFLMRFVTNYRNLRQYRAKNKHNEEEEVEEEGLLTCGCEEKLTIEQREKSHSLKCNANYAKTVTHSFTSASNNFELSLAMAIALYGDHSKQAIAAVYGPLIEVPILLLLTFVARYFKVRYVWHDD